MRHVIFDLDDCLVNTGKLLLPRSTRSGRDYLVSHPGYLSGKVSLYDSKSDKILSDLRKMGCTLSVLTNSPESYATSVLGLVGLENHFSLITGNASKPGTQSFRQHMSDLGAKPNETLFITDAAKDVLAAKKLGIPTLGVTYGYSSHEQLKKANTEKLIESFSDLEESVYGFVNEGMDFLPYTPEKPFYDQLPLFVDDRERPVAKIYDYYPANRGYNQGNSRSNALKILDLKFMRDLKKRYWGENRRYFYEGIRQDTYTYQSLIDTFSDAYISSLVKYGIRDSVYFMALPSSSPEWCYREDPVHEIVKRINGDSEPRKLLQMHGAEPLHEGHRRDPLIKLKYMGFRGSLPKVDQIILLDDVYTTGTTMHAARHFLIDLGYSGKISYATIGKTV